LFEVEGHGGPLRDQKLSISFWWQGEIEHILKLRCLSSNLNCHIWSLAKRKKLRTGLAPNMAYPEIMPE
jgi:hypothetical protein